MQNNKSIKNWFVAVFLVTLPFMYSCSNECIEKNEDAEVLVNKLNASSNIVKNQFEVFLGNSMGSRSGDVDSSNWDIDNITEICNPSESLYAYLVVDSDNPDKILGGCSTAQNIISTFFTFEKQGDIYILKDEEGVAIADVKFNTDLNQFEFVNIYISDIQSRATASEWCTLAVGTVGSAVVAATVPLTVGASIGFCACWGVISSLLCR